jgi:hypothetical protein
MNNIDTLKQPHVHILSRAFDSWVVEFRIDVQELLDQQRLLHHLRGVKHVIASTQFVAESCLVFDGIVRKTRDNQWVDVVVRIKKKTIPKGNPTITFKEEIGPDGTPYSHMLALLSLYYIDEFESVITHDRIMKCIREANIQMTLVDLNLIECKLREVIESQLPCANIPIAHGVLPENGTDAEVEFFFHAIPEVNNLDVLYSSRRVQTGDLLCRKIPPAEGQRNGTNVMGNSLVPRPGLDIVLQAGANATCSLDGLEIVAEAEGVVVVSRANRKIAMLNGTKEFPESITVKVNPILKLDGNDIVDMITNSAVEITGNLRVGSRIITDSEVFISGDIERGASITASEDIIVKGDINGAKLSSQQNIYAGHNIFESGINAQGNVHIEGKIAQSTVIGDSVTAESASGSRILARKDVTLQRIDADVGNVMSTISVGMHDFFIQRLQENQQFLEAAKANLDRIKMVVGEDVIEQVNSTNVQMMLLRVLSRLHIEATPQTRQQINVYRKLIEAVPPTRALVEQKERECLELAAKLTVEGKESDNVIVIRERIASKTVASINGIHGMISETDQPVKITRSGNQLATATGSSSGLS